VELSGTFIDFATRLTEAIAWVFAVIALSFFIVPRRQKSPQVRSLKKIG